MSIPVSVVVVSRDRPDALYRCLISLSQLQYPSYEIIVVSDATGLTGLSQFDGQIKTIQFEEPNISAARNAGIAQAAGEIVAFIDDDAVAEPTWLTHLIKPFEHSEVGAVGGFVRGRNGISFQWKARILDDEGHATALEVDERSPTILSPVEHHAIKTEGTNMAVRRSVLASLGGFDPAYHFFLDETDLNFRLAKSGQKTAIAPLAQVHHGFAASPRRWSNRVPRDLFDIGASWAVFQRKFIDESQRALHWHKIQQAEKKRLIEHMVGGGLEPASVQELMGRLKLGYEDGSSRSINSLGKMESSLTQFFPFPATKRTNVWIMARPVNRKQKRKEAVDSVKNNEIVTVFILSSTTLYHHLRFHVDGYWEQTGGLFGKSRRSQRVFRLWSRKGRAAFEIQRVKDMRCAQKGDRH